MPPLEPYPLKAKRVGAWLLARWNRGWVSNPPNTRSLVSSLTWYTVNVLEIFLDVRPYPGMDTIERKRLNRIIIAIGEMEDMALKRSIPLTLTLMRLFLQELRVPLPEYFLTGSGSRGTAAELRNARNIAMFALARACMLRKDDMTKGKLKVGSYRRKAEGEFDGSLLVAPGKAHRSHVFAHVPGCGDRGLSGGWQDLMFPGVAPAVGYVPGSGPPWFLKMLLFLNAWHLLSASNLLLVLGVHPAAVHSLWPPAYLR